MEIQKINQEKKILEKEQLWQELLDNASLLNLQSGLVKDLKNFVECQKLMKDQILRNALNELKAKRVNHKKKEYKVGLYDQG